MIPGLGRSPGEGNGNLLQYSFLETPHGQRSLAGYSPWGCKESDMTERLSTQHNFYSAVPFKEGWKREMILKGKYKRCHVIRIQEFDDLLC